MDELNVLTPIGAEHNRKTASQRKINFIWEATQAFIAISVVSTTLYVNACKSLTTTESKSAEAQSSALMQLNVMAALVTGFYFGRTNHQKSGGIGGDTAGPR